MEDPLIKLSDETIWYENFERIQEYLDSSKKPVATTENSPTEKLSWLRIMKKIKRTE